MQVSQIHANAKRIFLGKIDNSQWSKLIVMSQQSPFLQNKHFSVIETGDRFLSSP